MICIDLEKDEAEWIKNAILDKLENDYRGVQPAREEIIKAYPGKFADLSLEEWLEMHNLYEKVTQ